jgi:hypothetical protein
LEAAMLFCGGKCDPNYQSSSKGYSRSWSYVESSVSEKDSIYHKVLKIAKKLNDTTMIDRLTCVSNGHLVAVKARYLRRKGCLASYYSYKQSGSKNVNSETDKYNQMYKTFAIKLKEEYKHSVEVGKKVFYLSTLRERFIKIASEEGCQNAHCYKTTYLKKLLETIWPDITFVHQHGKSDIVCSSFTTVGNA